MPEGESSRVEYNYLVGRKQKTTPNSHELNRNSVWGMILNTGPTQTHRDPSTGEILNQHFKFSTENPGAYIIPGFYPQGDLLSVFTTVASLGLGTVAGATDYRYIDDFKEKLSAETYAIRFGGGGLKPPEEKKKSVSEDDLKKLYGDRVVVNVSGERNKVMIPTNYSANFEIGGSNYGNLDANFPEKIGKGGTAGKGGKSGFIDDVEFGEGSLGKYVFEVTGPVKGARVKREHNC